MRQVDLTPDGPRVSVLGLGCNNFGHNPFGTYLDYERSAAVVHAALEAGVTVFDTSDVYADGESETLLGRALAGRRDDVVIATKFGYPIPGSPEIPHGREPYVRWAVEGSLRRLQTDRLDLVQLHRFDPETPLEETLGVLQALIDEGKVRHVGASMFSAAELEQGQRAGAARVATLMTHYNLLMRDAEHELVGACERLAIVLLPFFPLESGLLTGKYRRGEVVDGRLREGAAEYGDDVWERLSRLEEFADERGLELLQVALGGLAAMPTVGPVFAGATRPEQVESNARAIAWTPSVEDLAELRALGPRAAASS